MAHNNRNIGEKSAKIRRTHVFCIFRFPLFGAFRASGPFYSNRPGNFGPAHPFSCRLVQSSLLLARKRDFYPTFRPIPSCSFSRLYPVYKPCLCSALFSMFSGFRPVPGRTNVARTHLLRISVSTRPFSYRLVQSSLILGRKRDFYPTFRRIPSCSFSRFLIVYIIMFFVIIKLKEKLTKRSFLVFNRQRMCLDNYSSRHFSINTPVFVPPRPILAPFEQKT